MGLSSIHVDNIPVPNTTYYVDHGIRYSQTKADETFDEADQLMQDLLSTIDSLSSLPQISQQLGNVSATVTPYVKPTLPVEPNIDTSEFPSPPTDPVTGTVQTLTLDAAPVFAATQPTINNITPPSALTQTAPTAPSLPDRTNSLPLKPSSALPVAPTARELTLPSAPALVTVNFDGIVPGALRAPPNTTFNWANEAYQSALNDALNAKLYALVQNVRQTGLSDAVRQQLRDKARERTQAEANRRRASARRQFAALGWNMPQGDEALLMMKAEEDAIIDDITENRSQDEIDAKLEQSNFQFTFGQAIALEGQLIGLHNAEQDRAFAAAKYTIEAAIQIYGLEVSYFNANVTLYETQARVYAERLRAQLNEVEIFKAQLEGQKLIGELNQQDVTIYEAKIKAVLATYELYKAELEGVKILLEQDALTLQKFEATVRAFAETVRAKSLEYEGYRARQDGEKIKVDMFTALSNAFRNEMEGFKIGTDAKIAKQDADIKIAYDVPLKVAEQKTEIYGKTVDAVSGKLKSLTDLYATRGQVYESEVKGEVGRVEAEVGIYEAQLKRVVAEGNLAVEAIKANIATLLAQKEMVIGIQKTVAQVKAQLTAAYGSAVHYSAGIHSGSSFSDNHSITHSYSESTSV